MSMDVTETEECKCQPLNVCTKLRRELAEAAEVLQTQLKQALDDIEVLKTEKEIALADPQEFVKRLQLQTLPEYPKLQTVHLVPHIEFEQDNQDEYYLFDEEDLLKPYRPQSPTDEPLMNDLSLQQTTKHMPEGSSATRTPLPTHAPSPTPSSGRPPLSHRPPPPIQTGPAVPYQPPLPVPDSLPHGAPGRLGSPPETPGSRRSASGTVEPFNKTPAFNQAWTDEEQKRLEELLLLHPHEKVAAQRWSKIASALGTRTPRQVASRTQKWFVKLAKAGLPVPGKAPNLEFYTAEARRKGRKKAQRVGRSQPKKAKAAKPNTQESDDSDEPMEESNTANIRAVSSAQVHEGYQCDGCGIEPIVGVRYKCDVCPQDVEVDLCEKCYKMNEFESAIHLRSHSFTAVEVAEPQYPMPVETMPNTEDCSINYLDPSFMPV
eukprot:GFYU01007118.1.p1 GENE.GFYU01007118.1~~GFYU01007118.1.p1  ORF type:complete len:434 (+),score=24.76 GFYU01007118.1:121-1422(+)